MEIECLRTISESVWNEMVHDSDETWLYHLHQWIEMTAAVYRADQYFIVARQNGKAIAGLALHAKHRILHSALMGPSGPFVVRGISQKMRQKVSEEILDQAVRLAKERRCDVIQCSLPPLAQSNLANVRGVNPLVSAGWHDVSTHTKIADLRKSENELWADLSENAHRKIKSAKQAGYVVERGIWPDMLDEYYRIHSETYTRTGVEPHPRSYFEGVAKIAAANHAVLWVGKGPTGNRVAFHNCARFNDGALYWTGCCRTEDLDCGVNYLLFWESMIGAKNDGCNWYEIGEAFPGADAGKLKGLTTFKGKFGGAIYRFYKGEVVVSKPLLLTKMVRRARNVIGIGRRRLLNKIKRKNHGNKPHAVGTRAREIR
jgi:hypothetical protein